MPKITEDKFYPITSNEYRDIGGTCCPYCGSEDIEGTDSIQISGGIAWGSIICNSCGKTWNDIYTLTGYEPSK